MGSYEGNDMTRFLFEKGWTFPHAGGAIRSITNVRDTAIIVTDFAVWRASPDYHTGFRIELLTEL